ncbi:MAG: hypothetical protein ACR2PR_06930 [Pseudohongiellaceae bacterium]
MTTLQDISRFRNGLSDAIAGSFAANSGFPAMDQGMRLAQFEDFTEFRAGDWDASNSAGGGFALLTSEPGGVLRASGTAGQTAFLLAEGRPIEFTEGQELWFDARVRTNLVTSQLVCGLAADTTTDNEIIWDMDAIGTLEATLNVGGGTPVTLSTTSIITPDVFTRISIFVSAQGEVFLFINDRTPSVPSTGDPIPYDVALSPFFGGFNAVSSFNIDFDYLCIVVADGRPA